MKSGSMGPLPEVTVDLALPARERGTFAEAHRRAARDLLRIYNEDLGVDASTMEYLATLAPGLIPEDLLAEMDGVSSALGTTLPHVLLANLHYDMLADPPNDLERCITHLCDNRVIMGITVQQMAFRASSGEYLMRVP